MKDDAELQSGESLSSNHDYSTRQRRTRSSSRKSFYVLMIILIVLIFVVGILYFIARMTTGGDSSRLQSRLMALEEKIEGIEKQVEGLQGRIGTSGQDPALIQKVDNLQQRLEILEKQRRPIVESKTRPSLTSKSQVSSEMQYHIVKKGETLYRISQKYQISVEELRRLNGLSQNQPLKTGQKLRISSGH